MPGRKKLIFWLHINYLWDHRLLRPLKIEMQPWALDHRKFGALERKYEKLNPTLHGNITKMAKVMMDLKVEPLERFFDRIVPISVIITCWMVQMRDEQLALFHYYNIKKISLFPGSRIDLKITKKNDILLDAIFHINEALESFSQKRTRGECMRQPIAARVDDTLDQWTECESLGDPDEAFDELMARPKKMRRMPELPDDSSGPDLPYLCELTV